MKQFLKKIIKEHIKILQSDRDELMALLVGCTETNFRYAFLNLELKWLEFKITIWEVLI